MSSLCTNSLYKMAASYLVKKNDTYYFRHYIPIQNQLTLGKKEFIKTLRVTQKGIAVKISRELKVVFDSVMDKTSKQPTITWKEIRVVVDQAFDIIHQKYTKGVDEHGPGFDDGYNPYDYMPIEYEQEVLVGDSSLEWGTVGDIHQLADKINEWGHLKVQKGSKEYDLLCFRTIQMLYEHKNRKENPEQFEPNILHEINDNLLGYVL